MRSLLQHDFFRGAIFGVLLATSATSHGAEPPEARLKKLKVSLSKPTQPTANYVNAVRTGNLLFVSGRGPGKNAPKGKLGKDLSVDQGYQAARITAVELISILKQELGDLRKVKKIVRLNGMVNSTPDFTQHPKVINGASDLLVEVFGKKIGTHTRIAIGVSSLPFDIPVELDLIAEVRD